MEQYIWFLGRFHVLVLHLPLGILTLAVSFEILARFRPLKALNSGLAPVWIAGALSAIATALLGFMHASEDSFQGIPAVEAHRWAGIALCLVACFIAVLRTRMRPTYERFWAAPVAAILFLMLLTGHLGGKLTHGETYLVQYAPGFLRVMAGLPASAGPRPRPQDLASADIYLDVVQPALEHRCSTCHNDSKRSGGLSVASYEALMKGGSKGPVVKPGDPAGSNLFNRVSAAPDSKIFMPKDGKTPLSHNEVAAIGWWIQQGAPGSAKVGSLKLTAEASSAIQSIIGAQGTDEVAQVLAAGTLETALPTLPPADKDDVARILRWGFSVRNVYQGSNLLDVDYTSPVPVTPEIMADLSRIGPHIWGLNLRRSGITDAEVKTIVTFRNLRHLRLEYNLITDKGASDIATLTELTNLNLSNTRVTDSGLNAVARLPRLKALYLWGTLVTPEEVEELRTELKAVRLDAGLSARNIPTAGKVVPPDF